MREGGDEMQIHSFYDQGAGHLTETLISCKWLFLCRCQVVTAPNQDWSESVLERLSVPNLMAQKVPNVPPDYYTCQFRTNKLERYRNP